METIDISRVLREGTAVWPGDTPFTKTQMQELAQGHAVNLTTLSFSAHCGTHVDAPVHFLEAEAGIDQVDLAVYWGPAQVVTVSKASGPLYPADFDGYDLSLAPRLLVRSAASGLDQGLFPEAFVYPSPELAEHLGGQGIILYGSDCPSMDFEGSKSLDSHHALARQGIYILEWLDLRHVKDGLYELAALPLRIAGGDGSPVRAALRRTED
jgi:arylformamidase